MKNPSLTGPVFTPEQETLADWFHERGWKLYAETLSIPDDPDYEGPFDDWTGGWKELVVFTMAKDVPLADGTRWVRCLDVPAQMSPYPEAYQRLVDLGEAALKADIEDRNLEVA